MEFECNEDYHDTLGKGIEMNIIKIISVPVIAILVLGLWAGVEGYLDNKHCEFAPRTRLGSILLPQAQLSCNVVEYLIGDLLTNATTEVPIKHLQTLVAEIH